MTQPLVTIPIAAYRSRPEHLIAAVESALAQTWREIEIVVSDDSPEPVLERVVRQVADHRVRYRHNVPRLGVAENHWRCFREARGTFIAVLNHDDLWSPTFLEALVTPLVEDFRLAVAFCDHWVINANGDRLTAKTDKTSRHYGRDRLGAGMTLPFYELFAAQTLPMAMGAVFRRNLLPDRCLANVGPAFDLWLSYVLCREGLGAYYVPERLSSWREHPENQTSQGNIDWLEGAATCWAAAASDPRLRSVRHLTSDKAARAYSACAVKLWRAGRRRECYESCKRSLSAAPTIRGFLTSFLPLVPRF